MHILRRIILLLVPALWILGMEMLKNFQDYWWIICLVIFLQLILTIWYLGKFKFNKIFVNLAILPALFAFCSFVFILFLIDSLVFHLVIILSAIILYLLLKQYNLYFNFPFKYQPYSLESLSLYLSLISAYFLFSSCFGSLILLQLNFWLLLGIIVFVMGLITYQFFWIHKINFSRSWLFVAIILIVLVESFVAVSFFPTSYYVNGFVLTTFYYLMLGLSKYSLSHGLTKKRVASYLIVSGICLAAVLFTAQWS